ncbi:CDP-glycerol: N-acetyl-beta-D-mannosaminyl-1,4-N-acetyl-D-glucosaminyldiphosphoundecaprenyl glycerophosphotransferase [hydrothermal vent metagenome]|uniref:CDP-glycerol: N-acetyl-beta-D-mannosaminyl-1,4-N-acetyl-D-glucosaminyldiphosphoundecaprenyl glycerophosphotransferase n=1 Tax=hydrothermal vent metagenome TaxID=652676 RepID=A0A3B0WP82_9ZZZZ
MTPHRYLFYATQNYSFAILRPLQSAIRSRGGDVAWFLAGEEIDENYLQNDENRLHSVKQVNEYQPRAVFASSNVVPYLFPGIKVELFHGFNARKRGTDPHFNIRGFFDLYCTQGPDTTHMFQQLAKQHGHFRVVETGWPKLDPMFAPHRKAKVNTKPVILYTSTFSKNLTSAPALLETIKKLSAKGDYQWLVTFHPKMDKSIVNTYKDIQSEHLTFIETDNVIPLLMEADVMLSDTSSILQEFLILNKPVVTFNNNQPVDCMIDIKTPEELLPALEKALTRPKKLIKKIQAYSEQLHPYYDGESSERVLDATEWFISEGYKDLKRKPLNLLRKIKIRKRLGYSWL